MVGVRVDVLKREIEKRGSQEEFARLIGTTASYISLILNKHRVPGPAMRKRLTTALGMGFEDLFTDEERKRETARR